MENYLITKENGRQELFTKEKLFNSLLKAKVEVGAARQIVEDITANISNIKTTQEIRNQVFTKLCDNFLPQALIYNLRVALAELPPKSFEMFIKKLLDSDGYLTEWEKIIRGAATEHEVDVVARKGNDWYLIECKHRYNFRKYSGQGKILQVQARFDDIKEGYIKGLNKYNFTRAWVINNAKFSEHAKEYAKAKGIWLTGWNYPNHYSLAEWIQHLKCYPVTMLNIDKKIIAGLVSNNILTFNDFTELMRDRAASIAGEKLYHRLIGQIRQICQ